VREELPADWKVRAPSAVTDRFHRRHCRPCNRNRKNQKVEVEVEADAGDERGSVAFRLAVCRLCGAVVCA